MMVMQGMPIKPSGQRHWLCWVRVLDPGSGHPTLQQVRSGAPSGGDLRGGPREGPLLSSRGKLCAPSIYILARAWYGNLGVWDPILGFSDPCVLAHFGRFRGGPPKWLDRA